MGLTSVMVQLAQIALAVLDFVSSPTGGRDIGRSILRQIGLRGDGEGKDR